MKKGMKLRNLILITTILITTTIVLVFGYVSRRQFGNMLTERTVDDYQETVSAMQKNVETLILYAEDFTKYMSLNEQVLDTLVEYQNLSVEDEILNRVAMKLKWDDISNQLIFSTSMIYSLEMYYGDTMVYSYYDDPSVTDSKNIPDEILEEALSQAPPTWTGLLTLRQSRSYAKKTDYGFAVVKSVRNETGQRIGLLAIYIRESSFSDILQSVNKSQKSRSYLVDENHHIFSAIDKSELYNDAADTLGLSQEEYETCVQNGILLKEQKRQNPLLYVSRNIGDNGVKLICETTMEELGSQQRKSELFTGVMMFLAVMCAIISAWFVSKRITKPLGELMEIMEQIKTDEKSIHLRFPEGDTGEIGVLGSLFNELMDELDTSMQQIYDEQRQRRHNEVRLLQAQIVPHFLYNTMGIIASFIKLGMPEKALETLQNLVSFYRLSLSSGKDVITIKEEVELTHNYMALQQLRYVEYMEYSIKCAQEAEEVCVPKLTIQPLVENVLHHGLRPNGKKCQIRISIALDKSKESLTICVHDNGMGMKKDRLEQLRQSLEIGESVTKSFGIFNINQRLKLLYGENYHMGIESIEGEYTQFTIYLSLKTNMRYKQMNELDKLFPSYLHPRKEL